MSQQEGDNPPVTFHDVAACFSEEEWKLLHEWQKDLYQILMTEIHQSLISLGPLIAATVFSLKPKEKEGNGHPDSERRYCINHFKSETIPNSSAPFKKKGHEDQELKNVLDRDCGRINEFLNTELPSLTSDNDLLIQEQLEGHVFDYCDVKGAECINSPTPVPVGDDVFTVPGVPFRIKYEGDPYLKSHQNSERKEGLNSLRVPFDGVSAVSSRIKEEKDTHCMNQQDLARTKNTKLCSTAATLGTLTCSGAERLQPAWEPSIKTPDGPLNVIADKVYSINKKQSESWQCTTSPTGYSTSVTYTKQEARNWQRTCKQSEFGRNVSPKLNQIRDPGIIPGEKVHEYADYDSIFSQRSNLVGDEDDHPVQRTVQNDCGKTSSESANLTQHHNIQTGVKLYICSQCGNYFSQSSNENPQHNSTCRECEKRLFQSTNQNKSRRKRTEKTSHVCRECGKICRHSQALRLHQRVHTGEKPHACGECGRCFSVMANLIRHRRIHTGEKPYTCSLCGKNFRQLPHLIKHQRMHMREEMLMLGSRAIS